MCEEKSGLISEVVGCSVDGLVRGAKLVVKVFLEIEALLIS